MSEALNPPGLTPLKRALLALEDLQARLGAEQRRGREPIAVIGIGCRLPGGVDGPEAFWRLLQGGVDAVTEVPADRWNADAVYDPDPEAPGKANTRWGGFLSRVDGFDPLLFGVSPREAVNMDPQQRLLLEVSWEALEHAGQAPDRLSGSRTGVFLGICSGDYQRLSPHIQDPTQVNAYTASGTAHSIASGRLSYVLGLQGPAVSVDTACSSSLVAFHLACQSLRGGECRMALSGGVHVMLAPDNTILFCKSRMMSPTGRCHTFGAGADGFVLGEGCGVVVLKRLADAQADGDRILAVVRGTAVNQDGPSGGLTVPNGPAQEAVIREALACGGVAATDVGYVEAHGTGTSLGDPIEVRALAGALGAGRPDDQPLLIGSVKTNMGHLEAAAGVTGLIKAVLAVHHGEIPPHLHAGELSPHIPWDELPVAVARAGARWPEGRRRIAGVSAFGFSGTNAHAVVEEPPLVAPTASGQERPRHLLALSARTESALRELAGRHAAHLASHAQDPGNVAFTVNTGRSHLAHRRALSFRGNDELREQLGALAAGAEPDGVLAGALEGMDRPRVVFLFTGQGAQYAGMGRALYETQPTFRRTLDRCQEILRDSLERPLLSVMFEEGALLDQTAYTQPALFAIEYALAELWRSWGVLPSAAAGHSVGEYVAACVAGVFSLEDGLRLIAARGRLMQALPPGGVMVAVQADEARVREAMAPFADQVDLAAVNAPTSLVLSGAAAAIAGVCARLHAQAVKTKPLAVSHAFHSPLMEPMRAAFEQEAARVAFAPPTLTLVSNVTGEPFRAGVAPDAAYWSRHVRAPVRLLDSLAWLNGRGYSTFLEIGPAPTLSGLGPQCVADPSCLWLPSLRKGRDDWETLLATLGALYVRGGQVDWRGFDRDYPRRTVSLPTYPFERERYWFAPGPVRLSRSPAGADEHPLLGRRVRGATVADTVFEQSLAPSAPDYLQDHRVHDLVVFPGTGYLELGLAAGAAASGGPVALHDVTIREPLVLSDEAPTTVQTVVASGDGGQSFRVFSQDPREPDSWRLHAEGRVVRAAASTLPSASLEALRAACPDRRDAATFYAALAERGLPFGEGFRGVSEMSRGQGEAVTRVVAPEAVARALSSHRFHPALLDACLQALAGAFPDGPDEPIFMPIGMGAVEVLGEVEPRLFSHARVQRAPGGESAIGEVSVYRESDGLLVARILQIALKRADPEALVRAAAGATGAAGWMYEVAWERNPLPEGGIDAAPLAPIAETMAARLPVLSEEHGFTTYAQMETELDAQVAADIVLALQGLGWAWSAGESLPIAGLATRLGVAPRRERAFLRLLELLVELRWLRANGGAFEPVLGAQPAGDTASEAALLERHPGYRAEITLARSCGRRLAEILRGDLDPLQVLFPEGSLEVAEQLYVHSPGARAYNHLAQEVLTAIAPSSGPLRILEIGGGTGGTTSYLLPRLPKERTEYLFTDVSPLFAARAAERFGEHAFLRTQALDIEKDPAGQGLEGRTFDVIVAANVLHATADLRRTFRHVQKLLSPGGVLVMIEVTRPQGWIDVTFGLTDGWWLFTDADLRSSYPLLTREQWLRFLRDEAAFAEAVAIPGAEISGREPAQAILVARSGRLGSRAIPSQGSVDSVVLVDEAGVGDRLSACLEGRGARVLRVRRGTAFATTASGVVIDPDSPADWSRLLSAAGGAPSIVHLWGLDTPRAASMSPATLQEEERRACGSVLHLVKALAASPSPDPPRLFLVTRGAQPAADSVIAPAQATLWGLGKVIALEHPELRCTRIDLAPAGQLGEAAALADQLAGNDGEDQIALRPEGRLVPRLLRHRASPSTDAQEAWALDITSRGILDNLEIKKAKRLSPGPGEVEIEVRAIGLNFRDVLNAMGLYPGAPPPFGSECSGTITAVGQGASGLAVGDDVIAVAPGSFRSHLVAPATFVFAKPAALSFEEAATLAVPFVTAWFCLRHVARLGRGEKVLIHAAAGGVGQAAVQIARMVGAEVFATAGSEDKRAFLSGLGVDHVLDSRSLSFAEEVRRRTDGRGVDVVLNSLAGEFVGASFGITAKGGRFVEIGKREIWEPARAGAERPDVGYTIVDWGETAREEPALIRGMMEEILALVDKGALVPLPRRVFPASATREAFRYMAQGRHLGKVVVSAGPQPDRDVSIRSDGTYLITGGLAGLGLLTAEWLVERGARYLALVGRHAPEPEALPALERMGAAGAIVRTFVADVADVAGMGACFAEVSKTLPALAGVVHSAGALDDGVLTQLDWTRFQRVLAAKVDGAWILHQATREQPLDFFVMYSSVASVLGSPGQANHAAANAFLDALAHHRRACGLPAVSLNWGAWKDVGAAARLKTGERAAQQGVGGVPPREGLEALAHLLAPSRAQIAVAVIDWPKLLSRYSAGRVPPFLASAAPARTGARRAAKAPAASLRQILEQASSGSREHVLRTHVREEARKVLGLAVAEDIDPKRPLQELGLDSLMAVELRNALGRAVGSTLPATLLFDHPTVNALVAFVAGDILGWGRPAAPASPAVPPGDVLSSVEDLSDAEVARLLSQRMGDGS